MKRSGHTRFRTIAELERAIGIPVEHLLGLAMDRLMDEVVSLANQKEERTAQVERLQAVKEILRLKKKIHRGRKP